MFVKVCGITSEQDALLAIAMGADALGFVFAPSPRQVASGAVALITSRLPSEVLTVGVFRDTLPERILEIVTATGIKGVQLHGRETPEVLEKIRPHVHFSIKAFSAGAPELSSWSDFEADALLVDSETPGSGRIFDWRSIEGLPRTNRLILAGGLNAANVGEAIKRVRPWGVDVSSGVERSTGHKDPTMMLEFVTAARGAAQDVEGFGFESPPLQSRLYDWQEEE